MVPIPKYWGSYKSDLLSSVKCTQILSWYQSRVTHNEDFQVCTDSIASASLFISQAAPGWGVRGKLSTKKHLQGCLWVELRFWIWQNSYSMKTCTPHHHSPTRNSSGRTISDILKHLQIFRDGAMKRKNAHKVNHHHLNALCLTGGCLSEISVTHVFFPETFVYRTFSLLLSQITLRTEGGARRAEIPRVISGPFSCIGREKKCRLFQR